MKRSYGWVGAVLVASGLFVACASSDSKQTNPDELGTVALPLTSNGPSGVQYRLRNATFQITSPYYYYGVGGSTSEIPVAAGAPTVDPVNPMPTVVSSETDPDANSIEVELEQGTYQIYLQPGWSMERLENGVATPVEAQLLNNSWQWVWVSPHSTSWVSYQFGIGDHAIWFNGKLNIDMQVYENPDEYYGPSYGGFGGMSATGGATYIGAGASASTAGGYSGI